MPALAGGVWRLWAQFALRGAGFPAVGVLRLAPEGLAQWADTFDTGVQLSGRRWEEFEAGFGRAAVGTAGELQRIAAEPAFRAAVAWQNRAVLSSGIAPFLAWNPQVERRTSMARQREELVARYWQRFCVKNDTIGFFGPVGWGRLDPAQRGVVVDPGEGLIARSEVYFSSWAIDALAKAIDADPRLRPWLVPRRVPFVKVADGAVRVPSVPPQRISRERQRVLALCDGRRTARDIQREVGSGTNAAEILSELAERRWIRWRLEVPADTHPERHLRAWLEGVGDPDLRRRAIGRLEVLERGRDRVRAAGDEPELLRQELAALEVDFEQLTDTAGLRKKGATTAPCRTLVYSDSVRAAGIRLGGDLLAALAPLDLLMTSAAWLASQLAERVLSRVEEAFDRLSARAIETGVVDLATFWFACLPILHGDAALDAADIQQQFWKRWGGILRLPAGARRVRVSARSIVESVSELFGVPDALWTAARYVSPDVMIAAADLAALGRGDYELVLGELHVATNTLGASLFVNQHPAPGELFAQTTRDHPAPRLMPLLPKEHRSRLSVRIRHCLVRPEDYHVALVDNTADPHRTRTVLSADVTVERRDNRLVAVLPDGAGFGIVEVFSHVLTTLVMNLFQLVPDTVDHTPRVTLDRIVIGRETWRFVASGMGFAREKSEAMRFVRARRWRDAVGLPRFCFVTTPVEPRPLFVDFDSPVYVSILARAARRLARKDPAARLTVSEMLPTPDQAWLTDDQGRAYTSELRFVAVCDPAG